LGELGGEGAQVSYLSALGYADGFEVPFFEVQAVGDHELHAISLGRVGHGFALLCGDRHWFFAKHVNAGIGGAHGVFAVQIVGQDDIHCVDDR
jgi:hypothetical protein